MSRLDCVNNRNIKIIAAYVRSRLGTNDSLFDGVPYPEKEFSSHEDFFLNEDEWTTYKDPLLEDLIDLRLILYNKYQRQRIAWDRVVEIDRMVRDRGGEPLGIGDED